MKRVLVMLLVLAWGCAPASHAGDGFALGIGSRNDADQIQFALTRPWARQWPVDGGLHVKGYWEVSAARWRSEASGGRRIWNLGFAPVFRLQPEVESGWRPYLEGAVGLYFLSHTHVDEKRDLGSAFQFGDHLGVGLIYGERGQFEFGYRFQHFSNAGIKDPNSGINFHQLRLGYNF